MVRAGKDYWTFDDEGSDCDGIKVGDRVDVIRHNANRKNCHADAQERYHGLLVMRINESGPLATTPSVDYRREFVAKRDEHSQPWGGWDLKRRSEELLLKHRIKWSRPWRGRFTKGLAKFFVTAARVSSLTSYLHPVTFRRGFIDEVYLTRDDYLKYAGRLFECEPVTKVRIAATSQFMHVGSNQTVLKTLSDECVAYGRYLAGLGDFSGELVMVAEAR